MVMIFSLYAVPSADRSWAMWACDGGLSGQSQQTGSQNKKYTQGKENKKNTGTNKVLLWNPTTELKYLTRKNKQIKGDFFKMWNNRK